MSLEEQSYSMLIVSSSEKLGQALKEIFNGPVFTPVQSAASVSAARRAVAEKAFDFVIINASLTDDGSIPFAEDLAVSRQTVVLVLIHPERFEEAYVKLVRHGVFLLQKPVSRLILETVSGWLISARERIRMTEKQSLSIEEKMREIRLVNRAKWLLISELKMSEPDAHRFIEKQAMNLCISKRQMAEEIIRTYGDAQA